MRVAIALLAASALCVAFAAHYAVGYAAGPQATPDGALGRGFGDKYAWYKLDAGIRLIADTGRPGMIVVHKSWCGACKSLGPVFAAAKPVLDEAHNFVMINVFDDEEPSTPDFGPDGKYIPRIMFTDGRGRIRTEITSPNPKYKYFYAQPNDIVNSMHAALALANNLKNAAEQVAEPATHEHSGHAEL
ncbi:thioredoxin domain-containing protein 12 [Capsaspora owczarzaki ATCC 30864]|uniref:Thioredoxin domain-containing protein 12 n=1 Tax=Capsaspora owczarzaki (strain ATCC 30864) TaxID=595528 RepID=A0A0D2WII1_CAPO3|nr:thioredoxin domain-containing protein 12 [Capsaspora owczarzaki ATCC 30864]KJE89630.1 thioredoxin domain-containing protein 12 [Capsaspora owczarzaki ATCC 30864]|eukprot:XP_004365937.1 thioredoxin domain-containing protein 12 [Capsaspora owczarzaki ATCC 30864]